MLGFCGYNFLGDKNALDPTPNNLETAIQAKVTNGIFNHIHMTRNVTDPYNNKYPTTWDFMTIMDCNFDGTINAGNVDFLLSTVTEIRVKRRKKGTFEWITFKTQKVESIEDLSVAFNDYLNANYTEYEYAYVPVMSGVEGDYIVQEIKSQFQGVFLCDRDTIYKFYSDVNYGTLSQVQQTATFEPFGSKYPIVVTNGEINYKKGNLNHRILPSNYLENRQLDRFELVQEREKLLDFINNKKAKILKDWNGNFWLIVIVDTSSVDIDVSTGMMSMNSQWVEQGDAHKKKDLIKAGMVDVEPWLT